MTSESLKAFRLGDIRGTYPDEISETFVERFAHAFVGQFLPQGAVAVGRDMRDSSKALQDVLLQTLRSVGVDVIDLGLCPTEMGYFASAQTGVCAAMVVTASHNPPEYNGIKCVLAGGRAITSTDGLYAVRDRMLGDYRHPSGKGQLITEDFHERYLDHLRGFFPPEALQHGSVALNGLNGTAGALADEIVSAFELPVTWFRKEPGPIPTQGADPANPRLVSEMGSFMHGQGFSLGVAWDGDCDRCVCFDNDGNLIPAYYLIGLLAESFLRESPGAGIVFDTKLCFSTLDTIRLHEGVGIPAKTGHAFMKQKMHAHRATYGGELSSHHYFGDFFGCDSGMFAWLTVLKLLGQGSGTIESRVAERKSRVCCTPEISLSLSDSMAAFKSIESAYGDKASDVEDFDGPSYCMPGDWRFSLRRSKTEPVVRVNFESRGDPALLLEEADRVLTLLDDWVKPEGASSQSWQKQLYIQ